MQVVPFFSINKVSVVCLYRETMNTLKELSIDLSNLLKLISPERLGGKNITEQLELLQTLEEIKELITLFEQDDRPLTPENVKPNLFITRSKCGRVS
ncbi:Uncharacterised protein [Legionella steigerwaltii]|nr:Uncharacterised protein [Legionella steigerwaltii]